jgi:7-keto-8-aminopelargonate synthetase-like enzyme
MKQIAKISGAAYIMIFLAGFYANFAVLENLMDSDDLLITTVNFNNNHLQLGYGLLGFVVML